MAPSRRSGAACHESEACHLARQTSPNQSSLNTSLIQHLTTSQTRQPATDTFNETQTTALEGSQPSHPNSANSSSVVLNVYFEELANDVKPLEPEFKNSLALLNTDWEPEGSTAPE